MYTHQLSYSYYAEGSVHENVRINQLRFAAYCQIMRQNNGSRQIDIRSRRQTLIPAQPSQDRDPPLAAHQPSRQQRVNYENCLVV